ncbi:hypothetical protein SAMN05880582_108125 [Rhizobium sp. RU20A]|nr:hypothetical protein SAMN05880582_108125 [Rhizobium sp. RU20A]
MRIPKALNGSLGFGAQDCFDLGESRLNGVILFYNKYNATIASRQINPETGQTWGAPEVDGTLSLTELRAGRALDDKRIDALVAFLETLTDRRYEHLLKR